MNADSVTTPEIALERNAAPADTVAAPFISAKAKTFISLLVIHALLDCYAGIWPIYKHLAGVPLALAGFFATASTVTTWALQPMFGVWADRGYLRACVLIGTAMTLPMMFLGPLGLHMDAIGIGVSYTLMFVILFMAKLGQAVYHPAGATMAGNNAIAHRSTLVSIFVACGWLGYGCSQALFSFTHRVAGGHTELLLIPGVIILAWAFVWCRPVEYAVGERSGFFDSLKRIPWRQHRLAVLFAVLALMSALGQGLFFLLPEFMEAKGYPAWTVRGGALIWFVLGSALGLAPAGYLADVFGRRRVLVVSIACALVSFYAMVFAPPMHVALFALLCFSTGALMNMANPIGVAIGQNQFPNESSLISGVLMGLAWAIGSLAPWTVGQLASLPQVGVVGALACLGITIAAAWVMSFWLLDAEPA